MKTPEEWYRPDSNEGLYHLIVCYESEFEDSEIIKFIEKIQSDAWNSAIDEALRVAILSQEKNPGEWCLDNTHTAIEKRIKELKIS